jgi:hypothetical protein
MVLDFNSFMRQRPRTPRLQFGSGDFGVNNLAPQAGGGQPPQQTTNWGQVPNRTESPWGGYAPASQMPPSMNFQQQAPPVIGQPTPALASIVAGNAPAGTPGTEVATGLGQSGQQQVANAGVQGTTAQQPAWAKYTAGYDGGSYAALNDFDPWGNWGQYGPNQARNPVVHMNGSRPESDIDRVYRWTNDILRQQYGLAGGEAADPALRRAIFLANVERLKSEYAARGLDWNQSAFADMDRGVQARTGKAPVLPTSTAPGVNNAPGATGGAPGAGGAGGGAGGGGGGGAGGTDDAREFLMEDPRAAFRELMRRRGYGNLDNGGFAMQFLQSRYEPALQALAQVASGMGGEDAIANETFDSFLNNLRGGSLSRFAKDTARQAYGDSGMYRADAGDDANQKYYENVSYLNTLGSGGLVQRAERNRLDRFMNQYGDIVLRQLGGEQGLPVNFEEFMRQNGYSIFR